MSKMLDLLFSTNCQKILSFLIQNPDKEYFDRQISKLAGISRAGTNFALRDLAQNGLVFREKRGRMYFYKAISNDAITKQLKIVRSIILLCQLIKKLKDLSIKIVLYGSAAKGEDRADSDIDIFIMTRDADEVKKIIFKDKLRERIQYVIKTPNEFIQSKKNNPVFYQEVEDGILLWETKST